MLCLHCIASGEAAERLGTVAGPAVFSDARHVPARVPAGVAGEVTMRTPGFSGLQQERWLYHGADAAAFPGRAAYPELVPYPDAVASLREDCQRSGGPPEQINKCLHPWTSTVSQPRTCSGACATRRPPRDSTPAISRGSWVTTSAPSFRGCCAVVLRPCEGTRRDASIKQQPGHQRPVARGAGHRHKPAHQSTPSASRRLARCSIFKEVDTCKNKV